MSELPNGYTVVESAGARSNGTQLIAQLVRDSSGASWAVRVVWPTADDWAFCASERDARDYYSDVLEWE
ncbi:hypothetical protein [Streptomyces hydrogenans]|uniref:Uncharacterized protein n=1 Tax=Streptomyces hydrogenans TaxID=1873719 RepID=A0ABQ3PJP8_9ACTN|nr:hypothetical protein [Streptomyces hydrogenans]GHG09912.1 hypothetical protein GCM10018784_23200 [Streptomyces hydrogenans]GHI25228.1 hypothetical protein Shyd_65990 [Streptomyces hydrogenans]